MNMTELASTLIDESLFKQKVDDMRRQIDLSPDLPFVGCAVHIPASNEFFMAFKDGPSTTSRQWTKNLYMAHRFEHFADAYKLACEHRGIVVGLFKTVETEVFIFFDFYTLSE